MRWRCISAVVCHSSRRGNTYPAVRFRRLLALAGFGLVIFRNDSAGAALMLSGDKRNICPVPILGKLRAFIKADNDFARFVLEFNVLKTPRAVRAVPAVKLAHLDNSPGEAFCVCLRGEGFNLCNRVHCGFGFGFGCVPVGG